MDVNLTRSVAILAMLGGCSMTSAQDTNDILSVERRTPVLQVAYHDLHACDTASTVHGCDASRPNACCNSRCLGPSLYASINLRGSFDELQSGGYNTVGNFPNTGGDSADTFSIGGALGVSIPQGRGGYRIECEGIYVDPFDTVTNSFRPPTPSFFYQTEFSERWAVLGNLWRDIPLNDCWDFYVGGGLGGGGATMSVSDRVVQGSGSSTDFVWQAGCGLNWKWRPRVSVDVGYRYMDWGTTSVQLGFSSGNPNFGDFTADITSHQVFLGVRYNALRDLISR